MACSSLLGEKDLLRFRTKKCCRLKRKGCEFRQNRCQYSHSDFWLRRCPVYLTAISALRYVPILCPNVSLEEGCPDEAKIVNRCRDGGECPFAHSYEEVVYHPLFYKTRICDAYMRDRCESYYCPFVHGLAESREVTMFQLPFANGAQIPPHPCVIPQDKMLPDEDFTRMHKPPQITVQELCKYPTNIPQLDLIDNTHSFAKTETPAQDRPGWEFLLVDAIKIVTEKVSNMTVPQKECFLLLNETNKLSTLLLERMRTIEAEEKLRLHALNQTWNKRDDDTDAFSCTSPTMSHSSMLMQDENMHTQIVNGNNIDQNNFMMRNPQLSPFPMLPSNNHLPKNNLQFQSHNLQFTNDNIQNTFNQFMGNTSTFIPNLNLNSTHNNSNTYPPMNADNSLIFNNHSIINSSRSHKDLNNNNNNDILQSSLDTLASTIEHLTHTDDLTNTLNSLPQHSANSLSTHSTKSFAPNSTNSFNISSINSVTQHCTKSLTQECSIPQRNTFNVETNILPSIPVSKKEVTLKSAATSAKNNVKGNAITEEPANDSTACSTESSSVANDEDTSNYSSRLSMAAAR